MAEGFVKLTQKKILLTQFWCQYKQRNNEQQLIFDVDLK